MILQQTRGLLSSGDQLALDLPFAETKSLAARIGPTPTFTRASTATFVGSNGLIQTAAVNAARFDHDPVTLASRGLLIEEGRTNLVFPSDTLTTQTRTVTATAHTLSFYGTGTVVLSGVAIATVTGTGAFPTRTTLTFTPTAGSLILTVTGSVTEAQLEEGSFPTSYIPTTTSALARSADVCSITGANFTNLWNASEGTMYIEADPSRMPASLGGNRTIVGFSSGTYSSQVMSIAKSSTFGRIETYINNARTYSANNLNPFRAAIAVRTGSNSSALGGVITANTTSSILTADRLQFRDPIGAAAGHPTCTIAAFRYYKKRLPNAKLVTLTT